MESYLKSLRKHDKQDIIAGKLGISQSTYSRIEKGLRPLSLEEAKCLAAHYKKPLKHFRHLIGPVKPKTQLQLSDEVERVIRETVKEQMATVIRKTDEIMMILKR